MINKKLNAFILFATIIVSLAICGESWIHSKENQSYIEKILYEDLKLKNEYGKVESYKIVKVGRYFGSCSDAPAYDSYPIKIEGEKKSSNLRFRLYKDKDHQIYKYEIR
jgi:hypothetical protein